METNNYTFHFLNEPIVITKQFWAKDTLPLVSTSTLAYNHSPYIRDCIESILMQKTTFPVRIVIFDDCSTDGTREIIKEYEAKYPHLICGIYPKENTYQKPTRHEALKPRNEVRNVAKYIALCEGDDYWTDPLKLQKQVDFLEANPDYSMCFHNAILLYEGKAQLNRPFRKLETRQYFGEEILKEWTIPTASVLYRRTNYKVIHNPDFLYGDIILFLSLAENGKIWCHNELMSVYRKHEGGLTANKRSTISHARKFIKHHEAIKLHFGEKYNFVESIVLSKAYIGLSKKQLKKINIGFFRSIYIGFLQNPKLFAKHFIKIYCNF